MGDLPGWAYVVGPPLWAGLVIYFVRTTKDWPGIMARWNERRRDRATIENEQYERLAARLSVVEAAEEKCRHELADKERRLAKLEGYADGRGEARQDAAVITAYERQLDAAKRDQPGKGGKE